MKVFVTLLLVVLISIAAFFMLSSQKEAVVMDSYYNKCINSGLQVLNIERESFCQAIDKTIKSHSSRNNKSLKQHFSDLLSDCLSDNEEADYCKSKNDDELIYELMNASVAALCDFDGAIVSMKNYDHIYTVHNGFVYSDFERELDCSLKNKSFISDESFLSIEGLANNDYEKEMEYESPQNKLFNSIMVAIDEGDLKSLSRLSNKIKEQSDWFIRELQGQIFWSDNLTIDSLNILIDAGLPVEDNNNYYNQPLQSLLSNGKYKIADWLIEQGASLKIHDDKGNTLITIAAKSGHLELVKRLLAQGYDIEGKQGSESVNLLTPVQAAAQKGRVNVVNYLKENGALIPDGNARRMWGDQVAESSIYYAVIGGNAEILQSFINWGASQGVQVDVVTMAVYSIGDKQGDIKMLDILYNSGFKPGHNDSLSALFSQIISNLPIEAESKKLFEANRMLDSLMKWNIDVTRYEYHKRYQNVLHKVLGGHYYHSYFAENNETSTAYARWYKSFINHSVSIFIQQGAKINEQDGHGQTPLNFAAAKCYPEITRMLLESGADQSIKDKLNQLPGDRTLFLIRRSEKNKRAIDKILTGECTKTLKILDRYKS